MTVAPRLRLRVEPTTRDSTVTPIELFYDLVFVFALTQVTAMMADDLSPRGLVRGLLVMGLLWWAWVGYAWVCNLVRADVGPVRLVLFGSMAAMFVLALSLPEAFDDFDGGLPGPVVVAVCYFLYRLGHLTMFWVIGGDDPQVRRQLLRFAPSMLGGTGLLLVASQLDGAAQTWAWAAALLVDYVGTALGGSDGWRIPAPGHFAERHGLILIVALGESIVAIGVGVAELPISWPIVLTSLLGLAVACSLWWAYFDASSLAGEQALEAASEARRPALARDAYSYLHLPLLAGIVFVALGMKKVLEYVGDTAHHDLADALPPVASVALFGGAVLYLLGHVGFKMRTTGQVSLARLVTAGLLLAVLVAGRDLPAAAALGALAAALLSMVVFENVRYREHRETLRHRHHDHAAEHHQHPDHEHRH